MKRFLLALSFALLVPACVGDTADSDPASSSDNTAVWPSPLARAEANSLPSAATSCLSTCQTRYDTCLATADGDPVSECLCYNKLQLCNISCGGHGFLRQC